MNYSDFALFYDRLTENIDYEALAEMYAGLLCKCGVKGGKLLDLACGTGSLTVPLTRRGFEVTAADLSEDMLTVAAAKSSEVQWLCLDMTKLPFEMQFDAVICALDSVNHLPDMQAVQQSFDGVYRSLKTGGVFAADMNTPYKHREVLGNNAYTFDCEGLYCGWQNELDEEDRLCRVDMFLDFFEENEDGSYTRYSDSLSEIAPEPERIAAMLEKSGFTDIEIMEYITGERLTDTSEKFTVIARKG